MEFSLDAKKARRYQELCHAVQSGIAAEQSWSEDNNRRLPMLEPKHLRVGIDTAKVEHSALATLLLRKGLITIEEYQDSINEAMLKEVHQWESRLSQILGRKIILFSESN